MTLIHLFTVKAGIAAFMLATLLISGSAASSQSLSRPNQPLRMSPGAASARLTERVEPVCPDHVHTESQVGLRIIIGRDGHVKQIAFLKGHPMLVTAAIHAVSQWTYQPYTLQGRPVEVETTVYVKFQCPRIAGVPSPTLLGSPLP